MISCLKYYNTCVSGSCALFSANFKVYLARKTDEHTNENVLLNLSTTIYGEMCFLSAPAYGYLPAYVLV